MTNELCLLIIIMYYELCIPNKSDIKTNPLLSRLLVVGLMAIILF